MKKYYLVYYSLKQYFKMRDGDGNEWDEEYNSNHIEPFEFDKEESFLLCYKSIGNDLRVKHECKEHDEITINDIKVMI